jgi:membrane protein DedA with SNARE-associated domain
MNNLQLLGSFGILAYPLIFFLMFIEGGDATLLASGFLIRLGFFDLVPVFLLASAGIFIRDIILYKLGEKYGEQIAVKYGKFFCITPQRFSAITKRLQKSRGKTIFFSKFLYGLNHITILAVGASKINFKRFLKLSVVTIIFWEAVMLSFGYFLGHSFTLLKHYAKDISIFLAAIVIIFILLELAIKKFVKFNGNSQ